VALLGFLNRQVQGLDKELKGLAEKDIESKRLMTIPGVGPVSAVAGNCWIGTIERFSNSKRLSSYFGLAPKVRQSGIEKDMGISLKRAIAWCARFSSRRLSGISGAAR
jgi:transposase